MRLIFFDCLHVHIIESVCVHVWKSVYDIDSLCTCDWNVDCNYSEARQPLLEAPDRPLLLEGPEDQASTSETANGRPNDGRSPEQRLQEEEDAKYARGASRVVTYTVWFLLAAVMIGTIVGIILVTIPLQQGSIPGINSGSPRVLFSGYRILYVMPMFWVITESFLKMKTHLCHPHNRKESCHCLGLGSRLLHCLPDAFFQILL